MSDSGGKIKLFESQHVRTEWDDEAEKWWFSVVDIVAVLTEQPDYTRARKYWSVLKVRLKNEGSQLATNCSQLKLNSKTVPRDKLSLGLFAAGNKLCPTL